MAPINSRWRHIILALLALIPLIYGILSWSESANTIGQNIMTNWLATMIGAAVGVLIGLEVYRWQQGREQTAKEQEASDHETKILVAIYPIYRSGLTLPNRVCYNDFQLHSAKTRVGLMPKVTFCNCALFSQRRLRAISTTHSGPPAKSFAYRSILFTPPHS
jgi:hypothetical protein